MPASLAAQANTTSPWDGQGGHEDGREGGETEKIGKRKTLRSHERRLHLQGAVGLAAHGEQERDNDVESLEMRGSGPGHRQQARLDPDVRAAHKAQARVTDKVRLAEIIIRLLKQGLLTQGREERYVP